MSAMTLERPQTPSVFDPQATFVTCPPQCEDATSCDFCSHTVCETHPGEDDFEPVSSCRGGSAHTLCHREGCANRSCWADPDADWDRGLFA